MSQSAAKLITVTQISPMSGGYVILQSEAGSEVRFIQRNYAVGEDGFLALGFGREVGGLHEIEVISPAGKSEIETVWIEGRKFNEQRVNGLDPKKVTPPKTLTDRITKESILVNSARGSGHRHRYWRQEQFIWPAKGRITGVYGSQRFYNGKAANPHWGVDVAAPQGTHVVAPAGGTVVLSEKNLYYSGGTIVLDHGGGLTSSFLHLSKLHVQVGDDIKQGQLIAEIGSTGRSTGPHLDWRMNLHGVRIDAALWVETESP